MYIRNSDKEVCFSPFSMAEISIDGSVYPCCPRYTDFYSFGNIFEQSFEEIWQSEKADAFRKKLLNDDYSLCRTDICFGYVGVAKDTVKEDLKIKKLYLVRVYV